MNMPMEKNSSLEVPEWDKCIHCGYCLPACPTYEVTLQERLSPRGRIRLAKTFREGRIEFTKSLAESFDSCLGCRACEDACPVGVSYGTILEDIRFHQRNYVPQRLDPIIRMGLRLVIPNQLVLSAALRFGRMLAPVLPRNIRPFAQALPRPTKWIHSESKPAKAPRRPKAYVFVGCIQGVGFASTHSATYTLLETAGYDVSVVTGQTCCGALHRHWGDIEFANALARRNLRVFPDDGIIVVNSGGCGAALREIHTWFKNEKEEETARKFGLRIRDLSEALLSAPKPLEFKNNSQPVVVYQDSCHLRFVQGVFRQPRELIKQAGGQLVELEQPVSCCGSAGIYNFLHPEVSTAILLKKMDELRKSGVSTVITANPGCTMQLKAGIQMTGMNVKIVQLPEFLIQQLG
ncbi:MAG: (Fe-S)-binding protein [Alicyclobacillus sp.]|nr:(Fe-S)-binding protein [Alicyclobacillus sp.]